jgi:hypothetical protein
LTRVFVPQVLVEGTSKRSNSDLVGRTDGNIKLVFPTTLLGDVRSAGTSDGSSTRRLPVVGDFVEAVVVASTSKTLRGEAVRIV